MEEETADIKTIIEKHKLAKRAPKINWGEDFEAMPNLEKVVYLKKFANSFNNALDRMQQERNDWAHKANNFENQLRAAKDEIAKQKGLSQFFIQEQNKVKEIYQAKINALEAKIRELQE